MWVRVPPPSLPRKGLLWLCERLKGNMRRELRNEKYPFNCTDFASPNLRIYMLNHANISKTSVSTGQLHEGWFDIELVPFTLDISKGRAKGRSFGPNRGKWFFQRRMTWRRARSIFTCSSTPWIREHTSSGRSKRPCPPSNESAVATQAPCAAS